MAGALTGIMEGSYKASAAITKQRFVKKTGDDTVGQATVAGERCLGVAQVGVSTSNPNGINEVTAGKLVDVQMAGIAWVEFSASVAAGTEVATTNDGRVAAAVATNIILGIVEKDGGAAGQLGLVRLVAGGVGTIKA